MTVTFSKLGNVAEFINGAAFKPEDWGEIGNKIIRIQNLTDKSKPFNRTTRQINERLHVHPGDLLVSWSATLGVFEWEDPEVGLLNQHIFRVLPDTNRVDKRYLRHSLELALLDMRKHMHGATMLHVNRGEFLSTKLYLPSLPEQRRIATILDQADALRAKRRESLAQLDSLTQSIFVEMFGDPMTPNSHWQSQPISNFVAGFESGKSVAAEDENDSASSFRVLKVSAVTSLEYKPQESKAAPIGFTPQQSYIVRNGDLLFSRANTTDLIGATAYVSYTPPNLLLSDKLWRFVWHEKPRAEPLFISYLFRQPRFRAEIGRRASGTSGSMKNISQNKVLSIPVCLPPLELQRTFANQIRSIEQTKIACKASEVELDALFTSLQHRAFRGEL